MAFLTTQCHKSISGFQSTWIFYFSSFHVFELLNSGSEGLKLEGTELEPQHYTYPLSDLDRFPSRP